MKQRPPSDPIKPDEAIDLIKAEAVRGKIKTKFVVQIIVGLCLWLEEKSR